METNPYKRREDENYVPSLSSPTPISDSGSQPLQPPKPSMEFTSSSSHLDNPSPENTSVPIHLDNDSSKCSPQICKVYAIVDNAEETEENRECLIKLKSSHLLTTVDGPFQSISNSSLNTLNLNESPQTQSVNNVKCSGTESDSNPDSYRSSSNNSVNSNNRSNDGFSQSSTFSYNSFSKHSMPSLKDTKNQEESDSRKHQSASNLGNDRSTLVELESHQVSNKLVSESTHPSTSKFQPHDNRNDDKSNSSYILNSHHSTSQASVQSAQQYQYRPFNENTAKIYPSINTVIDSKNNQVGASSLILSAENFLCSSANTIDQYSISQYDGNTNNKSSNEKMRNRESRNFRPEFSSISSASDEYDKLHSLEYYDTRDNEGREFLNSGPQSSPAYLESPSSNYSLSQRPSPHSDEPSSSSASFLGFRSPFNFNREPTQTKGNAHSSTPLHLSQPNISNKVINQGLRQQRSSNDLESLLQTWEHKLEPDNVKTKLKSVWNNIKYGKEKCQGIQNFILIMKFIHNTIGSCTKTV